MQYAQNRPTVPQIARELGATAVMECSVRYAGDDVLITAQLIDPATDSHLWSDSYPGNMSNLSTIFAMQVDIAMKNSYAPLLAQLQPLTAQAQDLLLVVLRRRAPGDDLRERPAATHADIVVVEATVPDARRWRQRRSHASIQTVSS